MTWITKTLSGPALLSNFRVLCFLKCAPDEALNTSRTSSQRYFLYQIITRMLGFVTTFTFLNHSFCRTETIWQNKEFTWSQRWTIRSVPTAIPIGPPNRPPTKAPPPATAAPLAELLTATLILSWADNSQHSRIMSSTRGAMSVSGRWAESHL